MKKSSLFISAAITTFILAVLAGVIFYARAGALGAPVATLVPPTAIFTDTATQTLAPTDTATTAPTATSSAITPQEAAFIAATALGNTKIYSVDTATRYGMDVYKVTFSSGSVVYVSPDGHILVITTLAAINGDPAPTQPPSADGSSSSSSNSGSSRDSGEHEGSGGDD